MTKKASLSKQIEEQLFQRRTASVYAGQKIRARNAKLEPPNYGIEVLRNFVRSKIGELDHGGRKITVKNFCLDHAEPISRGGTFSYNNLCVMTKPSNNEKGELSLREYWRLTAFLTDSLGEFAARDVRSRLRSGGATGFKTFRRK